MEELNNFNEKVERVNEADYGYYSKVLKTPFDTLDALKEAEAEFYAKEAAKATKAESKKADAKRVEEAFKAMNFARKVYKERLSELTEDYKNNLQKLQTDFSENSKKLQNELVGAEEAYNDALKAFTEKYPEGFHITLKDGDVETTIDHSGSTRSDTNFYSLFDLFDQLYRF